MNECELFMACVELASPKDRAEFLDRECGQNAPLRQRMEDLLKAHTTSGSLLEHPAIAMTAAEYPTDTGATAASSPGAPRRAGELDTVSLDFLPESDDKDSLGRVGQHEILEVVGRGGMGIVFKARDTKLHRIVAIKVLAPELAANPTARKRFLREAQAAAAVSHDQIVTIHAVEETPLPYLVMEFIDGQSLQEKLDQTGPLEIKEILRIGRQIAAGLAAAHAQGLIHRDVKPANILLQNSIERVQITDFGLARAVDDVGLTHTGQITGTPQYMSPEQAQGKSIDQRSDLFSLGSVLYAMCSGHSPFGAETTMGALRRVCDETPRNIRALNPDIPDWLVAVIDRLLAKNADERYQTAAEVAEVLGRHLAQLQHPVSTPQRESEGRLSGGKMWHRCLAAVVVLLLASIAGLALTESVHITNLFRRNELLVTSDRAAGSNSPAADVHEGQIQDRSVEGYTEPDTASPQAEGNPSVEKQVAAQTERIGGFLGSPFVILDGEGIERAFETLAAAVAGSKGGDTIEIRGDGPFVTDPIVVDHALTIRADMGFRPVILLDPEHDKTVLVLLRTTAPLTLEGLEFQRTTPNAKGQFQAIIQSREQLSLANCRLLAASHRDCLWSKRDLTLRNSLLLVSDPLHMNPFSWDLGPGGRAVVDNCVLIGAILSTYKGGPLVAQSGSIRLQRNTVVAKDGLRMVVAPPPPAEARPTGAAIGVHSSQNVFALRGSMLAFDQAAPTEAFEQAAAEAQLRRFLSWHDEQNLYDSASSLWMFQLKDVQVGARKDLSEWKRLWSLSETGTLHGVIRFQGGDLFARAQSGGEPLTPNHFRLRPDSAGYRAEPDGKDLGADIDLVGPGAAYERWKKTPDYQQWLKDSGQLAASRAASATPSEDAEAVVPGEVRRFTGSASDHVNCVALSRDGRRALSTGGLGPGKGVCVVWDTATGRELRLLKGHTDFIQTLAFAPDSRRVLTGGPDQTVRLWDAETGAELHRFNGPGHVSSVAWSADGKEALFAVFQGTVILWDVENWKELRRFDHGTGLWSVDYCPTRRSALTAGGTQQGTTNIGVVRLWDLDTGTEVRRFEGHANGVWRAVFSPDGRRALSASSDQTVRLWDVESGQEVHVLRGHAGQVFTVAFASDGRRAMSGGEDDTLRLWDVDSGKELHRFEGHWRMVRSVSISQDGRYALSGSHDETARLWRLPAAPDAKEK